MKEEKRTGFESTLEKSTGSAYSAKQVSGKNTTGNILQFQPASYSGTEADRSFPNCLKAFRTGSLKIGGIRK